MVPVIKKNVGAMAAFAKRVAVDFDGVIVPFGPLMGNEPPIDGVGSALQLLRNNGYEIIIHTSRYSWTWWKEAYLEFGGTDPISFGASQMKYVRDYLDYWVLSYDLITAEKIPCQIYWDDMAERITKEDKLLYAVSRFLYGTKDD